MAVKKQSQQGVQRAGRATQAVNPVPQKAIQPIVQPTQPKGMGEALKTSRSEMTSLAMGMVNKFLTQPKAATLSAPREQEESWAYRKTNPFIEGQPLRPPSEVAFDAAKGVVAGTQQLKFAAKKVIPTILKAGSDVYAQENARRDYELRKFLSGTLEEEDIKNPPKLKIAQSKWNKTLENVLKTIEQEQIKAIQPTNKVQKAASLLTGGFGSMALALGATLATKNPNLGAGLLSTMESSDVYNQAIAAGKTPDEALGAAAASGIGVYQLEKWGIGQILKNFKKPVSSVLAAGFRGFLTEGGQEGAQAVWQNFVAKKTFDEQQKIFENVLESIMVGGVVGGSVSALISGNSDVSDVEEVLVDGGMKAEEAKVIAPSILAHVNKNLETFKQNAEGSFKEARMANLKGGRDSKLREGIEVAAPIAQNDLATSIQQAKAQGQSFDEWVSNIRGSGTQYGEYTPHLRKYGMEDYKNITELGAKPNEMVTIYRGIDDIKGNLPRKINDGDFVTTDFESARSYAASGKDVVSMKVPAENLYTDAIEDFTNKPFYTGAEYVYTKQKVTPITKSDLKAEWDKAELPTTPLKTDGLAYLGGEKKISPQELSRRDKLKTPKQIEEVVYEKESIEGELETMKSKLSAFDREDLVLFRKFVREYEKAGGDVETLRKKNPQLTDNAVQRYREENPKSSEDEAVDFINNIVTKKAVQELQGERKLTAKKLKKLEKRMSLIDRFSALRSKTDQVRAEGVEKVSKVRAEKNAQMKSLEEVRGEMAEYLKEIPKSERGQFLFKMKNAKNIEDVKKVGSAVYEIQKRLEVDRTKKKIEKEMKGTQLVKGGKVPRGKLAPEEQEVFNVLRKGFKDESEAGIYLINQLQLKDNQLDYKQDLINRTLADYHSNNPLRLKRALQTIKDIKDEGGLKNALKKFEGYQDVENIIEDMLERTGEAKVGRGRPEVKFSTKIRVWLENLLSVNFNMRAFGEFFDSFKKGSAPYEGAMVKHLDLSAENQKRVDLKDKWIKEVNDLMVESYNLKGKWIGRKLLNKVNDDNRQFVLSKDGKMKELKEITEEDYFEFADGKTEKVIFSKAELRKLWAVMQDENLMKSLKKAHGYTDGFFKAVEKSMTDQDKKFVEGLFKFYNESVYPEVNKVFRDVNFVNLPKSEKYTPITRVGFTPNPESISGFLDGVMSTATMNKGSLNSRQDVVLEIKNESDVGRLMEHIEEMSHYVAFAKRMRVLKQAFGSPEISKAVAQNFGEAGEQILSKLKKNIDRTITEGKETAELGSLSHKIRKGYVISSLAIKPKIGFNQASSFIAYAEKIPTLYFGKEFAKMLNPKSALEAHKFFMKYSPEYRTRGVSYERDLKEVAESTVAKRFATNGSIINALMFNNRVGDKVATLYGGYPYYKYQEGLLKKQYPNWSAEKIREKAILRYEQFTNETMQSSNISDYTLLQSNRHPFLRFMTSYMSSPILYSQKEIAYFRALLQGGRGNFTGNLKGFLLYHSVLPIIYQAITNALGVDSDDKANYLRAAILGNLNAFPIIGEGLEMASRYLTNIITKEDKSAKLDVFEARGLLTSSLLNQGAKFMRELAKDEVDPYKAAQYLAEFGGSLTGVPVGTLLNMYEGYENLIDKNYGRGVLMMMGYTPYVLGEEGKTENIKDKFKKLDDLFKEADSKSDKFKKLDKAFSNL